MKQTRREQRREQTYNEIKAIARRQMAEHGTAGLSLRAIAREMRMTPPAIYRYFDSLNDLLTVLITENFNALADVMEAVHSSYPQDDPIDCLVAMLMAYREWALTHPIDFQLIYGNPIPGYIAPTEITLPAARRSFEAVFGIFAAAFDRGDLVPSITEQDLPESLRSNLQALAEEGYPDIPLMALYFTVVGWARIHGMIMLELFDHIQPVVGNAEAFYRFEIMNMLNNIGLKGKRS